MPRQPLKISFYPIELLRAAFYAIIFILLYKSAYSWLILEEWPREDYNYCYLIPYIVIYLLWENKDEFLQVPAVRSWLAIIPLLMGIALYWLGELGGEFYTMYISSWLILLSLCLLHMGWEKIKTIIFPLFFILTMFPPPNFIYNRLSLQLKLISSQIGVAFLQTYGLSAYREGNVIDLGFTQLQVVDACSGLRYLFPLIILGLLLAFFSKSSIWEKIILVCSTIPISILTNSLRIASVGILYQYWGAAVAEGFFHDFSGWFIFMFSMAILLAEMWLMSKIFSKKSDNITINISSQDHQKSGLAAKAVPTLSIRPRPKSIIQSLIEPQFILAAVLLGSTIALSNGIEFREETPASQSFSLFPEKIGEWQGKRQTMEQKFIDELDFSDYSMVNYLNNSKQAVSFYVAYYQSQRKGESIHSPASCLPGGGWVFNESGETDLTIEGKPMRINRAFIQKGSTKQLVYFWFPMRGRILTNAYQLKLYNFWDALTKQRTDGALVRVITTVYDDEELKAAEARLQTFVKELNPVLNQFLPGSDN